MEIRARYVLIGSFVLAFVLGMFGFVYWIKNIGGLGQRTSYQVRFEEPVSGLTIGSSVLFNAGWGRPPIRNHWRFAACDPGWR